VHELRMPELSKAVDEGIVVTWFKDEGDEVREGDLVAEVQVEKVSSDVHAPADGRLAEILVSAGEAVAQGAPIAVVTADTEPGEKAPTTAPPAARSEPAAPAAAPDAREKRPLVSPAARRLARELGVDLADVDGSGPGGRITEADVRSAAEPVEAAGERLSPMRRTIAKRLREGLAATAQVTLTGDADVTDLEQALRAISASWPERATLTDALVLALARALRDHPRLAVRLTDDRLVNPASRDIGVAVAVEDGLLVPVVRAADDKDLQTLHREIAELAEQARAGALTHEQLTGAVCTITNLGAYRVDAFTPLLDPPQTTVLGVGRARPRPAVVGGQVAVRTVLTLSLTFDHQVTDGAPAAALLTDVIELLERPHQLAPQGGDPGQG
jgi:pyruvate dehydrogenase E2 component (dihydrolipoamide acetyltransferase)